MNELTERKAQFEAWWARNRRLQNVCRTGFTASWLASVVATVAALVMEWLPGWVWTASMLASVFWVVAGACISMRAERRLTAETQWQYEWFQRAAARDRQVRTFDVN